MGGLKNSSESFWIFCLGTAPVYYGRRIFYYGRPQKLFTITLIIGLGTAPVYYGRRIFYYGRPLKLFTITLDFLPGNSTSLLWEEDFLLWEASKTSSQGLWIFCLGTAPVYYGRRIFYYGRPLKLFTITLDYWPGNSTSLLWEEDFLLWEASKTSSQGLWIFGLGTAPVYYGRRIFYYGRPQKLFTITLDYWPGNSTSLLWEEDFLLWEASKNFSQSLWIFCLGTAPVYYGRRIFYYGRPLKLLTITLDFLSWEQHQVYYGRRIFYYDRPLKLFTRTLHFFCLGTAPVYYGRRIFYYGRPLKLQNHFGFFAWEQHQFIMGGGFFIMGGLKNFSQPLYIFVLGTAPVYYGRRIFYYGRPQKLFTITLNYWPGNSTSLLWEEDFLLWEASKIIHNHFGLLAWEQHQFIMGGGFFIMGRALNLFTINFGLLAWEQHQFIMGGGFFIMGGLKNFSQPLWIIVQSWEQHQFIMGGGFFIMGGL